MLPHLVFIFKFHFLSFAGQAHPLELLDKRGCQTPRQRRGMFELLSYNDLISKIILARFFDGVNS